MEFNEDVVDVNRGLATAYHAAESRLKGALRAARSDEGGRVKAPVWDASWSRPSRVDLNQRF